MRCTSCQRNVAAGVEAQKMIVEYQQPDGTTKVFGYMMPDGPISKATGQMVKGFHHKCFWISKKREARGGSVTGRVMAGGPTGYDIDQIALGKDDLAALGITPEEALKRGTIQLSVRLARLREVAEAMGKGVGDAQVQEAFTALESGGPYRHQHHHRLETYQLIAHLEHAHGLRDLKILRTHAGLQDQHVELHAQAAQQLLVSERAGQEDAETPTRDWREQYTIEIE